MPGQELQLEQRYAEEATFDCLEEALARLPEEQRRVWCCDTWSPLYARRSLNSWG